MPRSILALLASLILCACAAPYSPVPAGYKGGLAVIRDSVTTYDASKADFFFVSHVDGKKIQDSMIQTRERNAGHGMSMSAVVLDRQVPAQSASFKIVGRTEYAAPILALTHTVYQVSGEIRFTPEADKVYRVKGELGEGYSAVWLEDTASGTVVGNKIEIKGSAALGLFEK